MCIYCKDLTGILIPLTREYSRDDHESAWVHITCVNWNSEVYFKEFKTLVKVFDDTSGSATPGSSAKSLSDANSEDPSRSPSKWHMENYVEWTVGLSGKIIGDLGDEYW